MADKMHLKIQRFVFNEFAENTYLLYAPGGEAIVFDLGCKDQAEWRVIADFVEKESCKPILLLNTHGHLDHVFGVNQGRAAWGVKWGLHPADNELVAHAPRQAAMYGLDMPAVAPPDMSLADGQIITLHGWDIEVIGTPGHSPGGVCFYLKEAGILFTGDTLFQGSVGRTDFYGGNMVELIDSIKNRLMTLPDETEVLPGHGPQTTIGAERVGNPFL